MSLASVATRPDPDRIADSMRARGLDGCEVALVLGSGLGAFADTLEDAVAVPQHEVEGLPGSTVPGHAGRFVAGTVDGHRVLCQQGRIHLYEGHSPFAVTAAVRAFARLGVRSLLLTNAAGGLVPEWEPGTLMRITDHINQQEASPLLASEAGRGTPYDEASGAAVDRAAERAGVPLQHGVYVANLGPTYETPAEVRMAIRMGGHAVGMSTALEAMAAHAEGLGVAAVSCITNAAAGLKDEPLSHEEVVEAGKQAAERFAKLVRASVGELAGS